MDVAAGGTDALAQTPDGVAAKVSSTGGADPARKARKALADILRLVRNLDATFASPAAAKPEGLLRCGKGDTAKHQFRWLAMQLHPDRLVGLPAKESQLELIETAFKRVALAWRASMANPAPDLADMQQYQREQQQASRGRASQAQERQRAQPAAQRAAQEAAKRAEAARARAEAAAKAKRARAESGLHQISGQIEDLRHSVDDAVHRADRLNEAASKVEALMEPLRAAGALKAPPPGAAQAMAARGGGIAELEAQVAHMKAAYAQAYKAWQGLERGVDALEAQLASAKTENKRLTRVIDAAEAQVNRALADAEAAGIDVTEAAPRLKAALKELFDYADRHQPELDQAIVRAGKLGRTKEKARDILGTLHHATEETKKVLTSAEYARSGRFQLSRADFAGHEAEWSDRVGRVTLALDHRVGGLEKDAGEYREAARKLARPYGLTNAWGDGHLDKIRAEQRQREAGRLQAEHGRLLGRPENLLLGFSEDIVAAMAPGVVEAARARAAAAVADLPAPKLGEGRASF